MVPTILPRRLSHRSAFTLVELLVVIAIIAVLISILLPAIRKAWVQAHRTQDLSNLRQLSAACVAYAGENRGYWPIGDIYGDPAQPYDNMAFINSVTFSYFMAFETDKTQRRKTGSKTRTIFRQNRVGGSRVLLLPISTEVMLTTTSELVQSDLFVAISDTSTGAAEIQIPTGGISIRRTVFQFRR